jgi:hypothetical protein
MKAKNHSVRPQTNMSGLRPTAGANRAETAVFATLGLMAVAAVAVAVVWGSVPAGADEQSLAALGKLPVVRYVRSGQCAADARTLAAMAHYLFESEKPVVTNVFELRPPLRNLAMPTNNASSEPKA